MLGHRWPDLGKLNLNEFSVRYLGLGARQYDEMNWDYYLTIFIVSIYLCHEHSVLQTIHLEVMLSGYCRRGLIQGYSRNKAVIGITSTTSYRINDIPYQRHIMVLKAISYRNTVNVQYPCFYFPFN